MAKIEQERAEQQRMREQEALRRRKEHFGRIKKMLEAAFDGDIEEIKKLLKEVGMHPHMCIRTKENFCC